MNAQLNKTNQEEARLEMEFSILRLEAFVGYGCGTFQQKVRFIRPELRGMFQDEDVDVGVKAVGDITQKVWKIKQKIDGTHLQIKRRVPFVGGWAEQEKEGKTADRSIQSGGI